MYLYKTKIEYKKNRLGTLSCGNGFKTKFTAPPEFGGYTDLATPEDLFVASINTCFMLTFETICKKTKTEFQNFECECHGTLENVDGEERMTKIVLRPTVAGNDRKKLENALLLAKKYCLVTNSITSEVALEIVINEPSSLKQK
jgi:organic hydroperoxide reductase OsmC/OhrA